MKLLPTLSRAEYDILRVLWLKGRQNVREVHDQLSPTTGWAYSTTKTMMDRMSKKNLLQRELFHGVFLYQPLVSRPAGLARFIHFFADRVLETDYASVVSLFAKNETLSEAELQELKELLQQLDNDTGGENAK